jgi:hypothetical protein
MATSSPADTELIVRVLVDVKLVGALIGKKGVTIKQLRAESGVQIEVSMQDAGITTPRMVTVQGDNLSSSAALFSPQSPPPHAVCAPRSPREMRVCIVSCTKVKLAIKISPPPPPPPPPQTLMSNYQSYYHRYHNTNGMTATTTIATATLIIMNTAREC